MGLADGLYLPGQLLANGRKVGVLFLTIDIQLGKQSLCILHRGVVGHAVSQGGPFFPLLLRGPGLSARLLPQSGLGKACRLDRKSVV